MLLFCKRHFKSIENYGVLKMFFPLGEKLPFTGYDTLLDMEPLPPVLLKGQVYKDVGLLYYKLDAYRENKRLRFKSKAWLLDKLFQSLTPFLKPGLEPLTKINWRKRVKAGNKIADIPFFFYPTKGSWDFATRITYKGFKRGDKVYLTEKIKEENIKKNYIVFCSWIYKETSEDLKIEVLFYSSEWVNLYLTKKIANPEIIDILSNFIKTPSHFIDNLIEKYLIRKSPEEREILKEKAKQALQQKGYFQNGEVTASSLEIMNVIRQATKIRKRKYKKKLKQAKKCLLCSGKIKGRGNYCNNCYRKRWFAFLLAEALNKKGLVEIFKQRKLGKLAKEQKEEILKEVRPENTRYTFNYFVHCLQSLQTNWPDAKAKKKLQELGF